MNRRLPNHTSESNNYTDAVESAFDLLKAASSMMKSESNKSRVGDSSESESDSEYQALEQKIRQIAKSHSDIVEWFDQAESDTDATVSNTDTNDRRRTGNENVNKSQSDSESESDPFKFDSVFQRAQDCRDEVNAVVEIKKINDNDNVGQVLVQSLGRGLFSKKQFDKLDLICEEKPTLLVRNRNSFDPLFCKSWLEAAEKWNGSRQLQNGDSSEASDDKISESKVKSCDNKVNFLSESLQLQEAPTQQGATARHLAQIRAALQQQFKLSQTSSSSKSSESESSNICHLYGAMKTNAFRIENARMGIFPTLAQMNHSCRPNVWQINGRIYACSSCIQPNTQLTWCYPQSMYCAPSQCQSQTPSGSASGSSEQSINGIIPGTPFLFLRVEERRAILKRDYEFICMCERCVEESSKSGSDQQDSEDNHSYCQKNHSVSTNDADSYLDNHPFANEALPLIYRRVVAACDQNCLAGKIQFLGKVINIKSGLLQGNKANSDQNSSNDKTQSQSQELSEGKASVTDSIVDKEKVDTSKDLPNQVNGEENQKDQKTKSDNTIVSASSGGIQFLTTPPKRGRSNSQLSPEQWRYSSDLAKVLLRRMDREKIRCLETELYLKSIVVAYESYSLAGWTSRVKKKKLGIVSEVKKKKKGLKLGLVEGEKEKCTKAQDKETKTCVNEDSKESDSDSEVPQTSSSESSDEDSEDSSSSDDSQDSDSSNDTVASLKDHAKSKCLDHNLNDETYYEWLELIDYLIEINKEVLDIATACRDFVSQDRRGKELWLDDDEAIDPVHLRKMTMLERDTLLNVLVKRLESLILAKTARQYARTVWKRNVKRGRW